jgi:Reverse transcriptase (RNA-dependent DNA polymerase)
MPKQAIWREFLDRAAEGQLLWKAAKYAEPNDNYSSIPPLSGGQGLVTDNDGKAALLMDSFFPPPRSPEVAEPAVRNDEILWEALTEEEVHRLLVSTKGSSAPGEDGVPALVWKSIWKYTSKPITHVFEASIRLGYHPKAWRTAAIVVLRKSGKPVYTIPEAYRPISLLNTLGKSMESVIAKRLSVYVEQHHLLPNTQFGGRPGGSTEQALLILVDAIWKPWRDKKVVTLMAFDIKGAFNSVDRLTLAQVLGKLGIPTTARK